MFGLVDRDTARREAQPAPRPAASPTPSRRGPAAPDAEELRSASPWFSRHDSTPADLSFRSGSNWSTGVMRRGHPAAVVASVGSPTRSDWRHAAVQLR